MCNNNEPLLFHSSVFSSSSATSIAACSVLMAVPSSPAEPCHFDEPMAFPVEASYHSLKSRSSQTPALLQINVKQIPLQRMMLQKKKNEAARSMKGRISITASSIILCLTSCCSIRPPIHVQSPAFRYW